MAANVRAAFAAKSEKLQGMRMRARGAITLGRSMKSPSIAGSVLKPMSALKLGGDELAPNEWSSPRQASSTGTGLGTGARATGVVVGGVGGVGVGVGVRGTPFTPTRGISRGVSRTTGVTGMLFDPSPQGSQGRSVVRTTNPVGMGVESSSSGSSSSHSHDSSDHSTSSSASSGSSSSKSSARDSDRSSSSGSSSSSEDIPIVKRQPTLRQGRVLLRPSMQNK